jgi:hypothetical protein
MRKHHEEKRDFNVGLALYADSLPRKGLHDSTGFQPQNDRFGSSNRHRTRARPVVLGPLQLPRETIDGRGNDKLALMGFQPFNLGKPHHGGFALKLKGREMRLPD